jgi:hypothetical protein
MDDAAEAARDKIALVHHAAAVRLYDILADRLRQYAALSGDGSTEARARLARRSRHYYLRIDGLSVYWRRRRDEPSTLTTSLDSSGRARTTALRCASPAGQLVGHVMEPAGHQEYPPGAGQRRALLVRPLCAERLTHAPATFCTARRATCALFVFETTCERGNRFLDRRFIVPIDHPELVLFPALA